MLRWEINLSQVQFYITLLPIQIRAQKPVFFLVRSTTSQFTE